MSQRPTLSVKNFEQFQHYKDRTPPWIRLYITIMWGPQMDFLKLGADWMGQREAIVTNPPYSNGLAEKFVRHALKLTDPVNGKVAMLLPLAWDSAKTRRDLFAEHPAFKAKYTLTRRIRWENLKQKKNGPSQNHAWYVWDWGQGLTDRDWETGRDVFWH